MQYIVCFYWVKKVKSPPITKFVEKKFVSMVEMQPPYDYFMDKCLALNSMWLVISNITS